MTRFNNGMATSVKVRVAEFQECERHDANGTDKKSISRVLVLQESNRVATQIPGDRALTNGTKRLQWIGAYHQVLKKGSLEEKTNQEEMDRQVVTASTV